MARLATWPRRWIVAGAAACAVVFGGALADEASTLSAEGQVVQDAYGQLADDLAAWDALKEAEAKEEPALDPDEARPEWVRDEWPGGLFGRAEAELPPALGYDFNTVWRHSTEDAFWLVYAGSHADSKFGVILIEKIDPYTMKGAFTRIDTDVEGPLSIAKGSRMTLTVESVTDEELILDVGSGSLADAATGANHAVSVEKVDI
ncbi:MAG: hypothetical protein WD096_05875 [Actinomycetota bacterium]